MELFSIVFPKPYSYNLFSERVEGLGFKALGFREVRRGNSDILGASSGDVTII